MTHIAANQDLAGRIAVITGASSGIGQASARQLAARGWPCWRGEALETLPGEVRGASGEALAIVADVTSQTSLEEAAGQVRAQYGCVDLLFNNAGIMLPGAVGEQGFGDWEQQIDLNVTGAMRVIRACLPQLEEAAGKVGCVVLINTSSIAAQNLYRYFAVYSATELQGYFGFQGAKDWIANATQRIEFLRPEDVAGVVAFIAAQPRHVNLKQVVVMPSLQTA